jgi:hypothetical protein
MIPVEPRMYSIFRRLGPLKSGIRRVLSSRVIWNWSGLTVPTALFATTGSAGSIENYLEGMRTRMLGLMSFIGDSSTLLDFGTGVGGNVLSIADRIRYGYGLDINSHYLRIADGIRRSRRIANVRFLHYEGRVVPVIPGITVVLAIGAFERIPKGQARILLSQLRLLVSEDGVLLIHFLTPEARNRGIGRILGEDAYAFWTRSELDSAFFAAGLKPLHTMEDYLGAGNLYVLAPV